MAKSSATQKTSGDGQPAGDWTQAGDGTDYPEELSKYRVIGQVNHDNKSYPIGSDIYLTDKQADDLLAHQAITDTMEVPIN